MVANPIVILIIPTMLECPRYDQEIDKGCVSEGVLWPYAVEPQSRGRGFFDGISEARGKTAQSWRSCWVRYTSLYHGL